MLTSLIPILGTVVEKAVSSVFPAPEDKDKANELEAKLKAQLLTNSSAIEEAAGKIVLAEAKGESWLQRNWRPGLMCWFAGLLGCYWLGLTPADHVPVQILDELFLLLQIGLGGYVVGRSGEKIVKQLAPNGLPRGSKPVDGLPWKEGK